MSWSASIQWTFASCSRRRMAMIGRATVHLGRNENEQALALLEPLVRETPAFVEARVSLATVYYRLKRKEDGDRERAAVAELTRAAQARQPTSETQQSAPATAT